MLNQQYQEPFLAVVIDPTRTVSAGKVEIGAFRTYPEGYKPPDDPISEYQTIPLNKIEDFGVHCKQVASLAWPHALTHICLNLWLSSPVFLLICSIIHWILHISSPLLIAISWTYYGTSIGWTRFRLLLCLEMETMLLDRYLILVILLLLNISTFYYYQNELMVGYKFPLLKHLEISWPH